MRVCYVMHARRKRENALKKAREHITVHNLVAELTLGKSCVTTMAYLHSVAETPFQEEFWTSLVIYPQ